MFLTGKQKEKQQKNGIKNGMNNNKKNNIHWNTAQGMKDLGPHFTIKVKMKKKGKQGNTYTTYKSITCLTRLGCRLFFYWQINASSFLSMTTAFIFIFIWSNTMTW